MADSLKTRIMLDYGPNVNLDEFKQMLWSKVPTEEYEDQPKDWIPEDKTLRFEWEGEPKKSFKSKGRPVILRGKDTKEWQEAFDELDNANHII